MSFSCEAALSRLAGQSALRNGLSLFKTGPRYRKVVVVDRCRYILANSRVFSDSSQNSLKPLKVVGSSTSAADSRGIGRSSGGLNSAQTTLIPSPTLSFDVQTLDISPDLVTLSHDIFSDTAEARLIAVVGSGSRSPWGGASWKEVLDQMADKLTKSDRELEMAVLEDEELCVPRLGPQQRVELFNQANIVVVVGVRDPTSASLLLEHTSHLDTVVAFDSHSCLKSRLGGADAILSNNRVTSVLSSCASKRDRAFRKLRQITGMWNRKSSDNILAALQLLINAYVVPVKSLQKLKATNVQSLMCIARNCGPQLLAVMMDPECRESLKCMSECDPTDQFGMYSCIVKHESAILAAFSQCALQTHNCLGLCAAVPVHLAIPPMEFFRGHPLTHDVAEKILIGWVNDLGWSWKISGNMFPIATHFASQSMTFYRESKSRMWYDPTFLVSDSQEGGAPKIWRSRHYSVKFAKSPGTFNFSTLDNGVITREFWTIVDAADDLAWSVMHSCGAAERTGQTFSGTVVVTPDGKWPQQSRRLEKALEKCDIKSWEVVRVDHSSIEGRPPIGLPTNAPPQDSLLSVPVVAHQTPQMVFFAQAQAQAQAQARSMGMSPALKLSC